MRSCSPSVLSWTLIPINISITQEARRTKALLARHQTVQDKHDAESCITTPSELRRRPININIYNWRKSLWPPPLCRANSLKLDTAITPFSVQTATYLTGLSTTSVAKASATEILDGVCGRVSKKHRSSMPRLAK